MSYLYETHLHTSEVSPCGKIPAAESVKLYSENGYNGIIVTDHFHAERYKKLGCSSWGDYIDCFLEGYRNALAAAPESFNVMLGMEIRFPENDNDYLVYGFCEDFLYSNPFMFDSEPKFFREFAENNNLLFFQAHPFRNNMQVVAPKYLHGIEIANYNRRHDSRNDIANAWAEKFSLLKLSGSDFHEMEDLALGGIYSESLIKNIDEFVALIKSKNYTLKLLENE